MTLAGLTVALGLIILVFAVWMVRQHYEVSRHIPMLSPGRWAP